MAESRELQVILTLQDQLSGSLTTVSANAKKLGAAFAVVGGAITAAGALALKSGAELDQLTQSFEFLTEQAGFSSDALLSSLQDVSAGTISNADLILSANKAMSLGVGGSMEEIAELMEVARLKARNMGITTEQAFDDIVTGLGRGSAMILDNLGITVKVGEANEQYAASIGKTVDELTAQEQKQALMNAVMVTAREELAAAGELTLTNAERLQLLAAQFTNMKDRVGVVLSQALEPLLTKLPALIEKVTLWIEENPKLFSTIVVVVGALGLLMAALAPILIALPGLVIFFGALSWPVVAVAAAIAALIAAGVALYLHWDTIKAFASTTWETIRSTIAGVIQRISDAFNTFKETVTNIFTAISDAVMSVINVMVTILTYLFGFYIGTWITIFDAFGIDIVAVFQTIYDTVVMIWNWLTTNITTVTETFVSTFMETWNGVVEWFTTAWNSIYSTVSTILLEMYTRILEFVTPVKDAFLALWDGISTAATSSFETVKTTIKNALNWIIEKINTFIRAANAIAAKGSVIPGVSIPTIPEIPMLAKGGIVTKPTLAMVGEAGPEAVIPLNSSRAAGAGGIHITVNGDVTGQEVIDKVKRALIGDFALNQRIPT